MVLNFLKAPGFQSLREDLQLDAKTFFFIALRNLERSMKKPQIFVKKFLNFFFKKGQESKQVKM